MKKLQRTDAPHTNTAVKFPTTRAEAEEATAAVQRHAQLLGCICPQLKVEWVKPPVGKGYAFVQHDRTCALGRMS